MRPEAGGWRIRQTELQAILAACGLAAQEPGPLRAILDRPAPAARPPAAPEFDVAAEIPGPMRDSLATLCSPRSLLHMEDATLSAPIGLEFYLGDGTAVTYREDADGWLLVSEPAPIAVIRDELADLIVGPPASLGTSCTVGDKVLLVLDHCLATGITSSTGVSRGALLAAVRNAGRDEQTAGDVLDALTEDGLLADSDGEFVLGPAAAAWRQAFPLSARLTLTVIDLAPDADPPRSLMFAGAYGDRILAADDVEAAEPATLLRALTPAEAHTAATVLLEGDPPPPRSGRPGAAPPDQPPAEALVLSGTELFALYDALFPATEASRPAGEPAEGIQAELRAALAEGRRRLVERGLIGDGAITVAPILADVARAWQDPALVVSIERTDTLQGTSESRCCLRDELLVTEVRTDGGARAIDVADASDLVPAVARLTGLDVSRHAAGPVIGSVIDADSELPCDLEVLVRVSAEYADGDLIRGGEAAFGHNSRGECWEIVEDDEPLVVGQSSVGRVRLVPVESSALLAAIIDWLPPQPPTAT